MNSYKDISLLVIKYLPIGWVNERMKIHNERTKSHIEDLHIQDMELIYGGHDSSAWDQCYEAKREYYMLKLKKCNRLSSLHLRNYVIPTCEWNY